MQVISEKVNFVLLNFSSQFIYIIDNQGMIMKYWIKYTKSILSDSDLYFLQ